MEHSLKNILGKILKKFCPVLLCIACLLGAFNNAKAQLLLSEQQDYTKNEFVKGLYEERDKLDKRDQYLRENIAKSGSSLAQVYTEADAYAGIEPKGEQLASVAGQAKATECPLVSDVKAKHFAGCWACLVIEKMTSAFLNAANKGLRVSQRAGVVLLIIGSGIWLVMWGLKNVSSFTEVQIGNILNDLIKFLFKVAIAYWFIFYSQTAISKYFINPIMSVGALVGQQFWDAKIQQYTEDYIPEDEFEPDDPKKIAEMEEIVAENNKKGLGGTNGNAPTEEISKSEVADDQTGGTGVIEAPQPVVYDSTEKLVQDIQKAFIAVLQRQLSEITNSCGGPCGKSCRYMSCSNSGHRNYVASIFKRATGKAEVNHYCQASITAAMDKLHDLIGSEATTVLKKAGAGCFGGINLGAVGDVKLCENGRQVYNQINVGDTVYYHNVVKKSGNNQKVGGGSGHHAVTYIGGSRIISFNGDSQNGSGSLCDSYYYNVTGKVLCVSCLIREKLKKNPQIAQNINTGQLSALAKGMGDMSLINYSGGSFSDVGSGNFSGSTSGDYSNLIVDIPEVKYTGPTNIMSKSVMNSILGATRAITNTTAGVQVLGDVIMCYASMDNGGAWHEPITNSYWTNIPMWVSGLAILCLGYLLTMTIGYYLIDISFKIGFAVLALPLVMGLWPFDMMKDRLFGVVSIIAKAAATFAFLALTTAFGMAMLDSAFDEGGLEELYRAMDFLAQSDVDTGSTEFKEMRDYVAREVSISSTKFILIAFSLWYFFKLIQSTSSDLVNKFFPDKVFGDSSPMHAGATMATAYAKKMAMKYSGANLVKDIAAHQAGRLVKGGLKKTGGGLKKAGSAVVHPVRTAKSLGNAAKGAINNLRGKGGAS